MDRSAQPQAHSPSTPPTVILTTSMVCVYRFGFPRRTGDRHTQVGGTHALPGDSASALLQTVLAWQIPASITVAESFSTATPSPSGSQAPHHRAGSYRYGAHHISSCSVDRLGRGRRRALQPVQHVCRRYHRRKPRQLDRSLGPDSAALKPKHAVAGLQEGRRARHPGHDREIQAVPTDFGRLQQSTTSDRELYDG